MRSLYLRSQYVALVAVPQLLFEYALYGRLTYPPLNIAVYNVLGVGGDSTLYGTEPWWFYLANLSLNFNLAVPLALSWPLLQMLHSFSKSKPSFADELENFVALSPLFFWLVFFSAQPHKEERFLFAVYPLFAVTAGLALDLSLLLLARLASLLLPLRLSRLLAATAGLGVLGVSVGLSLSRTYLIIDGFSGPNLIWRELSSQIATHRRSVSSGS